MKPYILIISLLLWCSTGILAQDDAIITYFDKYLDDEKFTSVYISGRMFEMISILPENEEFDADVKSILANLNGLRILSIEENGKQYFEEARTTLPLNKYEPLMTVRDGDQEVVFLILESEDEIKELLLLVGGEEEFVFLSFVGKIDLQKIASLTGTININGLEHLEKIEKGKK